MREIYKLIIYLDNLSMALTTFNSSCRLFGKKGLPPAFIITGQSANNFTKTQTATGSNIVINGNCTLTVNKDITCEIFMCAYGGGGGSGAGSTSNTGGGGGGGSYYNSSLTLLKGTYSISLSSILPYKFVGSNFSITCNYGGDGGSRSLTSTVQASGGTAGTTVITGTPGGISNNGATGAGIRYTGTNQYSQSGYVITNATPAISYNTTNFGNITCSGGGGGWIYYLGDIFGSTNGVTNYGGTITMIGAGNYEFSQRISGKYYIFIPNQ